MNTFASPIAFFAFGLILAPACLETRDDAPTDAGISSDAATDDDAGAIPDAGRPRDPLGADCVADAECASGKCALPCEGFGKCVPASCAADPDCEVPGDGPTHCCVKGACAAIEGESCGDRTGVQGTACAEAGASACLENLACVNGCIASSYCATPCTSDASCEALAPTLACYTLTVGGRYCVQDPNKVGACATDGDCERGEGCSPAPAFDGSNIVKLCQASDGTAGVGAACYDRNDNLMCRSGVCTNTEKCTSACDRDLDCACGVASCLPQVCLEVWMDLGGATGAAKYCVDGPRCSSTADCSGREHCVAHPEYARWSTVCATAQSITLRAAGAACTTSAQCLSNACYRDACRNVCAENSHCAQNEHCTDVPLEGTSVDTATVGLCFG